MKKNGFTLAEVLITLGIIGAIAAICVPAVISNYQDRVTEVSVKKFYLTMNEAIRLSTITNGPTKKWKFPITSSNLRDTDPAEEMTDLSLAAAAKLWDSGLGGEKISARTTLKGDLCSIGGNCNESSGENETENLNSTGTLTLLEFYNKYFAKYLNTTKVETASDDAVLLVYFTDGTGTYTTNGTNWYYAVDMQKAAGCVKDGECDYLRANNEFLFTFAPMMNYEDSSCRQAFYNKGIEPYWGYCKNKAVNVTTHQNVLTQTNQENQEVAESGQGSKSTEKLASGYYLNLATDDVPNSCSLITKEIQLNGWKLPKSYEYMVKTCTFEPVKQTEIPTGLNQAQSGEQDVLQYLG